MAASGRLEYKKIFHCNNNVEHGISFMITLPVIHPIAVRIAKTFIHSFIHYLIYLMSGVQGPTAAISKQPLAVPSILPCRWTQLYACVSDLEVVEQNSCMAMTMKASNVSLLTESET
ncbi:hypothetical protein T10_7310 [Trichinella papuae]|uniref:Uncharacterized protein n=1 Tax=Trichinella papuae TaxID=268474 RepID=A0A0V1N8B2_9BILA|nr:hypothetical protein T10_7310 [Trichinella papuae]